MMPPSFSWPSRSAFRNRGADLRALEDWWASPTRDALCLFGRRRVGKSWLFRAFADGKPAVILVADRRLRAPQMSRFADELEGPLGLRPEIADVAELIRVCYRLGRGAPALVVVDEFPYLLPDGAARERALTAIQRVMEEERDESRTKLILCGSLIGQMESLLAQASPLHGRLVPLEVRPMAFSEASELLEPRDDQTTRVTRYAVAGGMARHLAELGSGSLREAVCRAVLDRRGPLFDDPRAVLEQELRQPATYFSILEELADGEKSVEHLAEATGSGGRTLAPYLATLQAMRLISQRLPVGARPGARGRRFRIDDGFIRFWFRFVFPHQAALEEGLRGGDLWDGEIARFLPDHVAPTFEDLCARYVRRRHGHEAPTVGGWWGDALHAERRAGRRTVEEIDIVGAQRTRLRVVGECKWTVRPMGRGVLEDLVRWKLPALIQEGHLSLRGEGPRILLFSRAGFGPALVSAAASDPRIELVGLSALLATLEGD
jgi:AAA+ ATPase superfamily predicted ATPase